MSLKDEALRSSLRAWLEENLSEDLRDEAMFGLTLGARAARQRSWERTLHAGGWLGRSWPPEYGGAGAARIDELTVADELARAGAPEALNVVGFSLVGPVLLDYGTKAQCERYLPPILQGEELWCQGFSEPEAGSDLASLRTRADKEAGYWVVTGQKVWTSWAQFADRCILLARTDITVPKHRGISVLLLDMNSPGIEVRPIRQLTGDQEFCELFLDEVRIPESDLLGREGQGWEITHRTLEYERGSNLANLSKLEVSLREVAEVLVRTEASERLIDRYLDLAVDVVGLREIGQAYLLGLSNGTAADVDASVIKLLWSETDVALKDLKLQALGVDGVLEQGIGTDLGMIAREQMLASRAETIYGGSSQIQRNIIGERMLGLPRAAAPADKGVA